MTAESLEFECPACDGTGQIMGYEDQPYPHDCRRCRGNGWLAWSQLTDSEREAEEERYWDARNQCHAEGADDDGRALRHAETAAQQDALVALVARGIRP